VVLKVVRPFYNRPPSGCLLPADLSRILASEHNMLCYGVVKVSAGLAPVKHSLARSEDSTISDKTLSYRVFIENFYGLSAADTKKGDPAAQHNILWF
jgi:hypothetical protein